jgi:hypothetical protein
VAGFLRVHAEEEVNLDPQPKYTYTLDECAFRGAAGEKELAAS